MHFIVYTKSQPMPRQFDSLMLGSLELLCLTAELQSFTAAAQAAGVTPAAVSRTISRLEARLGIQLFARTTRQVRLSDAGRDYVAQCRQALAQLVEAERELTGRQSQPAGTVRLSLPTPYGHLRVLPLLAAFRARHPHVTLDVHMSNRNVDFVAEGFDLAVRGRVPPDSGLIARKLEDADVVVVAAPSYLKRRRAPATPAALADHDCIQFLLPSTGQPVPWLLRENGRDISIATQGGILCSDDVLATVTLARHGAGLLQTYRFIVEDDLREGRLREVLQPWAGASRPFSLLMPGHRHLPRRVRLLVDHLVEALARPASPAGGRRSGRPA